MLSTEMDLNHVKTSVDKIEEIPKIYLVNLQWADVLTFSQKVIWGMSKGDFTPMINALKNKGESTAVLVTCEVYTDYSVTQNSLTIVRRNHAGNLVFEFVITNENRAIYTQFAQNLQNCVTECLKGTENIPTEVASLIKSKHRAQFALEDFNTKLIQLLYTKTQLFKPIPTKETSETSTNTSPLGNKLKVSGNTAFHSASSTSI